MAVLINDFDIVLDPPASGQAAPETSAAPAPREAAEAERLPLTPVDLAAVAAHLQRRRERVRAH